MYRRSVLNNISWHLFQKIILATVLTLNAASVQALPTSHYSTESKLNSGNWVKVKTSGEGIHQISYGQLREWGFPNPEKVNVYGYGATLLANDVFSESYPDDVKLTYSLHKNENLYFYSTGDVSTTVESPSKLTAQRNYYSQEVFYLLSDRQPEADEIPSIFPINTTGSLFTYDAHLSALYCDEELQNPTMIGAYFLAHDITTENPVDMPVTVKNMGSGNTSWKNATFVVGYGALSKTATSVPVKIPSCISSSKVDILYQPALYSYEQYAKYKLGTTTLTINQTIPDGTHAFSAFSPGGALTFLATDYYWLIYPRLNRMDEESSLSMYFTDLPETGTNFSVSGQSSVHVIDVTDITHVHELELLYDATSNTHVGTIDNSAQNTSCHLVAFDTGKEQLKVEYVEAVDNQNFHGWSTPAMLIITTAELEPAAEQLAEIHRHYDNMDVKVVRHDLLFNEFSSATPDVMAYRRFIKMLYDREPSKLQYVIVYGPSYWDNRAITVEKKDRILVYETPNPLYSSFETKAFGSDSYLGMLNDAFKPERIRYAVQNIAVGRIPVADLTQGYAINRKIAKYIETPSRTTVYNTALVMSDDGDSNSHLLQAEEVAASLCEKRSAMTAVRAHNAIYRWDTGDAKDLRSVAVSALNRGTGLFVYVGHGTEDNFGAENLWSRNLAKTTSYKYLPICMLATCTSFGFDRGKDNIGESMLFTEDGGALCLIASGRTVYGALNHILALNTVKAYTEATSNTTFGQLWLDSRNYLIDSGTYSEDYQINTLTYNLGGDPALRFGVPTYSVKLTDLDGIDISQLTDTLAIEPLRPFSIEGNIVDSDGKIASDFNGSVTIQLYDVPYTVPTLMRSSDSIVDITLDHDLLASKTVSAEGGCFKTTFTTPLPVHEKGINRLTLHADSDNGLHGDGMYGNLSVAASQTDNSDSPALPPTIDFMAVSDNSSQDNTFLLGDVYFSASGSSGSAGINQSAAIGAGSTLVIDGTSRVDGIKDLLSTDNDTWTLNMALPELTDGHHTATLSISDNAGNRVAQTVSFLYLNQGIVSLSIDKNVVNDSVTFNISHDMDGVENCRLVIEDIFGNTVFNSTDAVFPLSVDFTKTDMPNGYYKAYVKVSTSNGLGASSPIEFIFYNPAHN